MQWSKESWEALPMSALICVPLLIGKQRFISLDMVDEKAGNECGSMIKMQEITSMPHSLGDGKIVFT